MIKPFSIQLLRKALDGRLDDLAIRHVEMTSSTNSDLISAGLNGQKGWTVLVAEQQAAGRGRNAHTWASPAGGLYFSLLLTPPPTRSPMTLLPLMIGLAGAEGVALEAKRLGGSLRPLLKWPNDLLTDRGKLAGILCETTQRRSDWILVAGMGINFEPVSNDYETILTQPVTSLQEEQPELNWSREGFLAAFLVHFHHLYNDWLENPERIRHMWEAAPGLIGKHILVKTGAQPVEGIALGISEIGALRVDTTDSGIVEISAAEGIEVLP